MEPGFVALLFVIAIVGVAIGIWIGWSRAERCYKRDTQYTQGSINVEHSDPEGMPNIFLGLAIPVEEVVTRKYITLDINLLTNDSQK